jgi:hypothetical protein
MTSGDVLVDPSKWNSINYSGGDQGYSAELLRIRKEDVELIVWLSTTSVKGETSYEYGVTVIHHDG